VQVLDKEIDRLDAVVKRFLDFTRPVELKLEATDLSELLREVVRVAQPQMQKAGVEIEELLGNGVPEVWADRDLLKQAVLNLVLNAAEAMSTGGEFTCGTGEARRNGRDQCGRHRPGHSAGKPTENISNYFLRPGREAAGSDWLPHSRIVQLHNGSIDFQSEAGRGTTFPNRIAAGSMRRIQFLQRGRSGMVKRWPQSGVVVATIRDYTAL